MIIRPAEHDDATEIAYIFNHYIATSHATFETEPVDANDILERVEGSDAAGMPFLICEDGSAVVGYAYAHRFRSRPAYRNTVETTVYIRPGHDGRGIASAIYKELISQIASRNFHTAIAGIALPNDPNVRLHERFGFKKVGHFTEVGFKFGKWFDVGFWQLRIDERESLPS